MGINQESIEINDPENGEIVTLTVTSLVSNVRDMLLMKIRNDKAKKVWSKMNEQEQAREIELAQDFSRTLVQTVASIVATRGSANIRALLDNFKVKDGTIIVTAKGLADDSALVALNHVGKKALNITVVDVDQFDEVRKPAEPDPDQATMFNHDEEDDDGPNLADAMHDAIEQDAPADDTADELQPYEQGAGAAEHGLQVNANPFDPKSDDFIHWKKGYQDWVDANPAPVEEQEPADESGLAELYDAVEPDDTADEPETEVKQIGAAETEGQTIEHNTEEFFDPATFRKAGVDARVSNQGEDECPYDGGTDESTAWIAGWRKADDEMDGLKAEGMAARRDGSSSKKNPWKAGTLQSKLWLEGYNEEKNNEKD